MTRKISATQVLQGHSLAGYPYRYVMITHEATLRDLRKGPDPQDVLLEAVEVAESQGWEAVTFGTAWAVLRRTVWNE